MWHCVKVVVAYSTDKTFRLEERNITELSDSHYTRHLPTGLYLRALLAVKLQPASGCQIYLHVNSLHGMSTVILVSWLYWVL